MDVREGPRIVEIKIMVKDQNSAARGLVEVFDEECKGCGLCVAACPTHLLKLRESFNSQGYHPAMYSGDGCTGCGICFFACPEPGAITVYIWGSSSKIVVEQDQMSANPVH
jgi:NAD-dependent dihydropyrimidine dehydrogenase PreA subunit